MFLNVLSFQVEIISHYGIKKLLDISTTAYLWHVHCTASTELFANAFTYD